MMRGPKNATPAGSRRDGFPDALGWAASVGDGLLRRAVRRGVQLEWPVREAGPPAGVHRPWDVYSGSAGIAFFFLHLGQATGERRFIEAGEAALARSLSQARKAIKPHTGLMGLSGLGQILLSLDRTKEALSIGERLRRGSGDECHDLLYGSAGVGTFLLSIYRRTRERAFLIAARKRGDRLLETAPPWPFGEERFIGYSHGPAGIGEFFLRLYAETKDRRYRRGAEACSSFISRHSERIGKRLETGHSLEQPGFSHAWCHGSPGIMLFEMAGAEILGEPAWCRRAEMRARATLHTVVTRKRFPFCYCHGFAGNLDLLLEYGWRDQALRLARSRILPHALRRGRGLSFPSQYGRWALPGFFMGDAGIGFFFLRLARPQTPLFYRVL